MATTDTPAALLREAAKLMRERAEAATPGPWAALDSGVMSLADEARWPVNTTSLDDSAEDRATRVHIASWHPLVALAVADYLEAEAEYAESRGIQPVKQALAVTRTYLGESDG